MNVLLPESWLSFVASLGGMGFFDLLSFGVDVVLLAFSGMPFLFFLAVAVSIGVSGFSRTSTPDAARIPLQSSAFLSPEVGIRPVNITPWTHRGQLS